MADNIRFGRPEATRDEVEAAARAIGADQVIAGLPDGFDTEVGERGALLSAASASWSPSPGPGSPTRPCCSWTRRPATWTRSARPG